MVATEDRGIVDGMSPSIGSQKAQSFGIALFKRGLQAMIGGIRPELRHDDAVELRIRPASRNGAGARPWLIDVNLVAQLHTLSFRPTPPLRAC